MQKRVHGNCRCCAKMLRHTGCQLGPEQLKSATTCDTALKHIIAGTPWLIPKVGIEYRAAFVERLLQKRASPTLTNPALAESSFGPLDNVVGGKCCAPKSNNNQQTPKECRRCWPTRTQENQKNDYMKQIDVSQTCGATWVAKCGRDNGNRRQLAIWH